MSSRVSAALNRAVRDRAKDCCEYCGLPEIGSFFAHQVDHVIATQHRGAEALENLALACVQCNRLKGPNLSSVDPRTGRVVRLFNPRRDNWSEHFRTRGGKILPLTAIGRATATLLLFDDTERQQARENLAENGCYPPARGPRPDLRRKRPRSR